MTRQSFAGRWPATLVGVAAAAAAVLAAGAIASAARAQNLIVDGSFEDPTVGPGGFNSGFQTFSVGSSFGAGSPWTVVGNPAGNVAVTPDTEFTNAGFGVVTFPAEDAHQWMDLTGDTDNGAATGVAQTIATTPGALYTLSFWVGEITDPTYPAPSGGPSTVHVLLDGNPLTTVTNSAAPTGPTINWQEFSQTFTATGAAATLTFLNGNPPGQALNGLDNVVVTAVPTSAPEPASLALVASALLPVCGLALRRR